MQPWCFFQAKKDFVPTGVCAVTAAIAGAGYERVCSFLCATMSQQQPRWRLTIDDYNDVDDVDDAKDKKFNKQILFAERISNRNDNSNFPK